MNTLVIMVVIAFACIVVLCGLLMNMFLYSRGVFRYRRRGRRNRFAQSDYQEFYTRTVALPEPEDQ